MVSKSSFSHDASTVPLDPTIALILNTAISTLHTVPDHRQSAGSATDSNTAIAMVFATSKGLKPASRSDLLKRLSYMDKIHLLSLE